MSSLESPDLENQIKQTLIDELMLPNSPDEIEDGTPLFGPDGLGLDSVDALQLVVALEKQFGLKIPNADAGKGIMTSVESIAKAIREQ